MLEQFPIFDNLDKAHLAHLAGSTRQISADKGSILFARGDATQGFYAVLEGAVRVYRVATSGREITQRIVEAGSTFAEASIFSDTYSCHAEALKDSLVCLISKDAFMQMIQNDSHFAVTWIRFLSRKNLNLCHRIEELSLKSPRERIASYLLLLSELQNSSDVELPVYRKTIATLLGMTHETFYRTTKSLEKERLLRFDKLRVEILDRQSLEKMIE